MAVKKASYDNYIGKTVRLFPASDYKKLAKVLNVDELGWTFKITRAHKSEFETGDIVFISHGSELIMTFEDWEESNETV